MQREYDNGGHGKDYYNNIRATVVAKIIMLRILISLNSNRNNNNCDIVNYNGKGIGGDNNDSCSVNKVILTVIISFRKNINANTFTNSIINHYSSTIDLLYILYES